MTRLEMEAAIEDVLRPHVDPSVLGRLVRTLALDWSEYTAEQIEKACRPYPWPPRRHRGPGEAQAERREGRPA